MPVDKIIQVYWIRIKGDKEMEFKRKGDSISFGYYSRRRHILPFKYQDGIGNVYSETN